MIKHIFLFPRYFKIPGILFFAAGLAVTFVRFALEIKPDFLDFKVFAMYSQYIDTKYFKMVDNNFGEEAAILLILCGLFLFAFSKEKEESEFIEDLRYKAMAQSFVTGFVFLVGAVFFTYGLAFIYMLVLNIVVPLAGFIVLFQFYLYRSRKIGE